ncbi:hypothetical protein BDV95DRAFT_598144 [Massariosphaeria phaeospora]|uniref:Uncharacterized protein n=1 Tax=Massariosphaeria phaeospora TaxID=100035 RepID=A0A7C8MEG5_9PLEO|nr:hypothetical protein BDV95DRAFT_598144 [Massariosphaeria phaeospora]
MNDNTRPPDLEVVSQQLNQLTVGPDTHDHEQDEATLQPLQMTLPFLSLPSEIRIVIYKHCSPLSSRPFHAHRGLYLSCQQVKAEFEHEYLNVINESLETTIQAAWSPISNNEEIFIHRDPIKQMSDLRNLDVRIELPNNPKQKGIRVYDMQLFVNFLKCSLACTTLSFHRPPLSVLDTLGQYRVLKEMAQKDSTLPNQQLPRGRLYSDLACDDGSPLGGRNALLSRRRC